MKNAVKCLLSALLLAASPAFAEGLANLLPAKLVNAAGEEVLLSSLEGKVIGLYFSAQWCPPCRAFTPGLVDFQAKNADAFQVVFVSSDRSAADMSKYMTDYKMGFVAVPFNAPQRANLGRHFGVRGIPTLIILDDQGNVISRDGRAEFSRDATAALAAWQAKAAN